MEKLPMCRICLAENVRMYVVVNKKLRELYEKLTDNPFVTEDSRPMLACSFCCSKLKQCGQFQRKCLVAEELFAQMMNEGYELNPLVNEHHPEFCNGFIQSPIVHVNIVGDFQTENVAIKEELPTVCETQDYITEPNEEYQSDELELENQENNFSNVEDIPAQHSDADSEDDVPLVEIKTENEVSRKKRRASDTQLTGAPVAKIPKLHSQRTKTENVNTEEQKKNEQSDATVIQNSQNGTFTSVMKFKEFNSGLDINCRTGSNKEDSNCKISSKAIDSDDTNRRPRLCVQEKPYICDICQRLFYSRTVLIRHIRTHTGVKPYECGVCQRCFISNYHLKRHMRTHTGEKPYRCDVCQACFSSNYTLTIHIRLHTGEKPYKCEICPRSFIQKCHLIRHISLHNGEKPYKCDICQSSFKDKSALKIHFRNHTGEKPYKCDICQRSFNDKSVLKLHYRTHTGEKPYKCDVCQACFNHRYALSCHIRKHTGVKPYKCDICQRSFNSKYDLTRHIRLHTGEKPYKCEICPCSFIQRSHLIRHIRLHTGEKPYKCDTCQRSFNDKSVLKLHYRTHTGEKPYKCDICQRCFSKNSHLTGHIRTHQKPYKCDICHRSFITNSCLTKHNILKHT